MNILILTNPIKKQSCTFAKQLEKELLSEGFGVYTDAQCCTARPDLAVIAGGDGTVLRYLDTVLSYSVPVLGVNFGHRGYLASCEPESALERIIKISKGEEKYESRILFECNITGCDGKIRESVIGLNEAVLSRGGVCTAVDFTLHINGNAVISFPADGIIVSTPTGSTAYNFSAEGPILMPSSDNLVTTPICASSLFRSSLVSSGTDVIEITMSSDRAGEEDEKPVLVADGFRKIEVDYNETVSIRKASRVLELYGGDSGDFLRVLQQKMM